MRRISKPDEDEYAPYVIQYIGLLPDDGLVVDHLRRNLLNTRDFLLALPENKLLYRYAEGKWTIKEIVMHLADDERIYAYRALRFARNDTTELPGFDQDEYSLYACANQRSLEDLLSELATVRAATLSLYEGLGEDTFKRAGVASGNVMSVRAIAYHIAGHEQRHMNIIRERYL
jgi:DinB superfamily